LSRPEPLIRDRFRPRPRRHRGSAAPIRRWQGSGNRRSRCVDWAASPVTRTSTLALRTLICSSACDIDGRILFSRNGLLCAVALQLPEAQQNSPVALARWLIALRERKFAGLATWVTERDERDQFEAWVKRSTEGSLSKAIQRSFIAKSQALASRPVALRSVPLLWPIGMLQRKDHEPAFKNPLGRSCTRRPAVTGRRCREVNCSGQVRRRSD
jgi:hypothetical protein